MDISSRSNSSLNSLSSQFLTEPKDGQIEEAIGPEVQHGCGTLGQECKDIRQSSLSFRDAQQAGPNFQQEAENKECEGLARDGDRMGVKAFPGIARTRRLVC
jgi:hypothetical protein